MPNNNTPTQVTEKIVGNALHYVSNFYQSFSGTDTLVFIMMPGTIPVVLGSITTLSYSLYRTKQPVIHLGRTNINGATRGARIFAGSMIFTMINQHWLKELQDSQAPLSMGFPRQEYWSGVPFPAPGDLHTPGLKPASPALAGGFFTTEPPGKSPDEE